MKKWMLLTALTLLVSALFSPALAYETREELREAYDALGMYDADSPYLTEPSVTAPYDAGELDPDALADALNYLNFLRAIAGLESVTESEIYDYQCQRGAVLLAANDELDHDAPQPDDMDQNFYDSAHLATTSSNIARLNWMRATILREGIAYFVRDDGDNNLADLGHRRWLLNPRMNSTGFGVANSESGMSYIVMYAVDQGASDAEWSEVCWPAAGVFPVELMHTDLAWSISLNEEIYDVDSSQIVVELSEETLGLSFTFDCTAGVGDGFCNVSTVSYGSGPCVIFRPDFDGLDFTDYLQNQVWTVRVTGLKTVDGEEAELTYTVEMASLYVQEASNVELDILEATLAPGETLALSASVIPSYADDLNVTWSSTDESVARVDEDGVVTAVGQGECEIVAETANGKRDACAVTVE